MQRVKLFPFARHSHIHTANDYMCQVGVNFPHFKDEKAEAAAVKSLAHIHAANKG